MLEVLQRFGMPVEKSLKDAVCENFPNFAAFTKDPEGRILIIGDPCFILAREIRSICPNARITVVDNNPQIDAIWHVPENPIYFIKATFPQEVSEEEIPYAHFGLVIAKHVINFQKDIPGFVQETRRRLTEDGLFFASYHWLFTNHITRALPDQPEGQRVGPRFHPFNRFRLFTFPSLNTKPGC